MEKCGCMYDAIRADELAAEAEDTRLEFLDVTFERVNSILNGVENIVQRFQTLADSFIGFFRGFFNSPTCQQNEMGMNHSPNNGAGAAFPKPASSNQPVLPPSVADSIEIPAVKNLSEIAGLRDVKMILYTMVILPRTQPQLFEDGRVSNTILLYGPPGTGKTRIVHGLAAESGAVLHAISVGALLSCFVGDTEKIKTELMSHLTKMETCQNTLIIAATNCPWDLDSAILRRFHKRLYIPLPDSEDRLELFRLLTSKIPIASQTEEQYIELDKICNGFSGSDIATLIQDAKDIPIHELQTTRIWNKTVDGFYQPATLSMELRDISTTTLEDLPRGTVKARPLTLTDFIEAAKNIQVTVTAEDIAKYEMFKNGRGRGVTF